MDNKTTAKMKLKGKENQELRWNIPLKVQSNPIIKANLVWIISPRIAGKLKLLHFELKVLPLMVTHITKHYSLSVYVGKSSPSLINMLSSRFEKWILTKNNKVEKEMCLPNIIY